MPLSTSLSADTVQSSLYFLQNLESKYVLPHTSIDNDNCLVMTWQNETDTIAIVIIDDRKINMIVHPGTSSARYFDNRDFIYSTRVPDDILAELPLR